MRPDQVRQALYDLAHYGWIIVTIRPDAERVVHATTIPCTITSASSGLWKVEIRREVTA